jgi:hypothetical protein
MVLEKQRPRWQAIGLLPRARKLRPIAVIVYLATGLTLVVFTAVAFLL